MQVNSWDSYIHFYWELLLACGGGSFCFVSRNGNEATPTLVKISFMLTRGDLYWREDFLSRVLPVIKHMLRTLFSY